VSDATAALDKPGGSSVGDGRGPAGSPRRNTDRQSEPGSKSVFLDPRLVRNLALFLIGASLVWRTWIALQGYFNDDDFVFAYLAAVKPLSWAYLMRGHAGHLMPGAFFVTWVMDKVAPLSFPAAVAVSVTIQAATSLALLRLLKLLFGLRAAILLPLAIYLFSPITLETFVWWAAALNHLPMQLGMVLALDSLVRYRRTAQLRWAVTTVCSFLFALLFFEKALLIPPLLFFFTAFFLTSGGVLRGLRDATVSHARLWGLFVGIGVGYYVLYRATADFGFNYHPGSGPTTGLAGTMVGTSIIPGLVGGPWDWIPLGNSGGAAAPPDLGRWISWEICAAAVLVSVLVRRRAARAWVLLAGYIGIDVALVAVGRLSWIGPIIGQAYRYSADAVIPAALCIAIAFIPMVGEQSPFTARWRYVVDHVPGVRVVTAVAATLALNLFLLSAGYSTNAYTRLWANNPAQPYMANVRHALLSARPGTVLLDAPVSPAVLSGFFYPYAAQSQVFAPFRGNVRFGPFTSALYGFDSAGHLVPQTLAGLTTLPGPLVGCGWGVLPGRQTALPLPLMVPRLVLTVKIAYLAGADTPMTVRLGDTEVTAPLKKGLNTIYFTTSAGGGSVVLGGTRPGVAVCVDKVTVGQRIPVQGQP
jgi:hypothetical protein